MAAGQPDITLSPPLSLFFFPPLLQAARPASRYSAGVVSFTYSYRSLCATVWLDSPRPRPHADV